MKKSLKLGLVGIAVLVLGGVALGAHHRASGAVAVTSPTAQPTTLAAVVDETPAPSASAASTADDRELGRVSVPVTPAPGAKPPTRDEWEAHGTPVALPNASRCLAAVLDGFMQLECESRRGKGFGVAVLSGGHAGVTVTPSAKGVTRVVFPMRAGDRRFFQLDEAEMHEMGGYEDEGMDTEVVPAVNVSVVWLEGERAPRVVVREA